ncbi:SH3 domain-containing protein [Enterobacteriaceae bacterium 4M9]|nr:SH3 domain-containing protein [Enterobacteriaceae bacterium 4M9]
MKNIRILLTTLLVIFLVGCQKSKPITDDTLVTSQVDGVTLTHRNAITPPQSFTPINEDYRALYAASLMSTPNFGGKIVRKLDNGETYVALGQVEHFWIALADKDQQELIGYVPMRAVVKSSLYTNTVRKDIRRVRKSSTKAVKKNCVTLSADSKACKKADDNTWIID